MSTAWKTRVVKIGNSQGIRLPRQLLEQAKIYEEVEVEASPGQLVIRSAQSARQGWEAQFQAMAEAGDDCLLDGDLLLPTQWEEQEWTW